LNAARVDFLLGNMACPEAQQKAADDGDDEKDEGGKHEGLRGDGEDDSAKCRRVLCAAKASIHAQ
jgi:hypothetical protein